MLEVIDGSTVLHNDLVVTLDYAEDLIKSLFIRRRVRRILRAYTPGVSYNTIVLPGQEASIIARESFYYDVMEIDDQLFDLIEFENAGIIIVSEWSDVTPMLLFGESEDGIRAFENLSHGTFGVYRDTNKPTFFLGDKDRASDLITDDEYTIYIRKVGNQWTLSLVRGDESFKVRGPMDNTWEDTREDVIDYVEQYAVPTHIPGMLTKPFYDVDIITRD